MRPAELGRRIRLCDLGQTVEWLSQTSTLRRALPAAYSHRCRTDSRSSGTRPATRARTYPPRFAEYTAPQRILKKRCGRSTGTSSLSISERRRQRHLRPRFQKIIRGFQHARGIPDTGKIHHENGAARPCADKPRIQFLTEPGDGHSAGHDPKQPNLSETFEHHMRLVLTVDYAR